ncbi:MAG TPA: class II aldolase/adducin family protein [Solirubrobacterales bacterium]|nr:class II aldolase/adducin family protein [Solirubrobacterales bacterium]
MAMPFEDPKLAEAATAVRAASAAIAESGLVSASSGNVSARVGGEILITPRRGRLDAIEPQSCRRVRIEDGAEITPDPAWMPSSETPLHLAVYRASDAGAVVHTHSTYATALSTVTEELPPIHYLMAAFGGPIRVAPYATFGSDELAENVRAALEGRRGALLANHGAVVYADRLERAVDLAHQLEWFAKLYLLALCAGQPALLDQAELDHVSERAATLRYGIDG